MMIDRQVLVQIALGAASFAIVALLCRSLTDESYITLKGRANSHSRHVSMLDLQEPFKATKFGPLRRNDGSPHRYKVLALWRAAEHSLETCMDATNTIFPHLQDTSCEDVDTAMLLLRRCERHQRDGLGDLAKSQFGVWEAFPKIIDLTRALSAKDSEMVSSRLAKSAALYSFNHLAALHATCNDHRLKVSDESEPVTPLELIEASVAYVRRHLHPVVAR